MSRVCENWTLEKLCDMSEEDMDTLLRSFNAGGVPTFEEIRLRNENFFGFDGSFGWW